MWNFNDNFSKTALNMCCCENVYMFSVISFCFKNYTKFFLMDKYYITKSVKLTKNQHEKQIDKQTCMHVVTMHNFKLKKTNPCTKCKDPLNLHSFHSIILNAWKTCGLQFIIVTFCFQFSKAKLQYAFTNRYSVF